LLGVGCKDQIDIFGTAVKAGKRLFDRFGMIDREVKTPRAAALVMVLLHRHADRPIVDYGDHLAQVLREQPVKQHLVAIVQSGQVDVPAQRIRQALVLDVGALDLSLQRADVRRQQAVEAQRFPFDSREGCPFVQRRRIEHGQPTIFRFVGTVAVPMLRFRRQ